MAGRDSTGAGVERASARAPRLLVLEPYYGGSHRAVLDCLLPALGLEHDLLTLPARKWKWRMRGSAITFADEVRRLDATWRTANPAGEPARPGASSRWDLVLVSTFVSLAEFRGLAGPAVAGVPTVVYFHENQLVYPNRHEADWDLQFPLTNLTSALAADECWFNTAWNLEGLVSGADPFVRQFPDHHPKGLGDRIAAKSRVLHPPFDPAPFDAVSVTRGARCRIVWPHRWEHDKNPEDFFAAVGRLVDEGLDFEVAVAGQSFGETREAFERAGEALGGRLVHIGEPGSSQDYAALLASADVAVSTALNEFFGLAMLEAAYAGCLPLVPDRLAYPEIYPPEMRYAGDDPLVARLRDAVLHRPAPGQAREIAEAFTVSRMLPAWRAAILHAIGADEGDMSR